MTDEFKNMSVEDIAETISWDSVTAAQVDAAFEALKPLDPAVRKNVVDTLESALVADTIDWAKEEKMFGSLVGMMDLPETKEDTEEAQANAQIFLHIAEIKGEAAHPLTKALVKEFAKLSDHEYNSGNKILASVMKAYDDVYAPAAPKNPNPFRKPKTPGM